MQFKFYGNCKLLNTGLNTCFQNFIEEKTLLITKQIVK